MLGQCRRTSTALLRAPYQLFPTGEYVMQGQQATQGCAPTLYQRQQYGHTTAQKYANADNFDKRKMIFKEPKITSHIAEAFKSEIGIDVKTYNLYIREYLLIKNQPYNDIIESLNRIVGCISRLMYGIYYKSTLFHPLPQNPPKFLIKIFGRIFG